MKSYHLPCDHGIARRENLSIETDAGTKELRLHPKNGVVDTVTVDMGEPILDGSQIPVAAEGRVVDAPLEVGATRYRVTCVSMGNPHCVVFFDEDIEALPLSEIGPKFEHHPFFPKRVNTEFIRVFNRGELRMRVWERGSGETAACGTGACAALVAAVLTERADRRALLHLNGGDLSIEWEASRNHVLMTGGATEVFSGELDL
ncbi:MAG: diaminopimelate epimerase [Deltaproteobacteria bacterium]|nr:diaminopimelate epimerase [Deltaproteobacteria bacterium]